MSITNVSKFAWPFISLSNHDTETNIHFIIFFPSAVIHRQKKNPKAKNYCDSSFWVHGRYFVILYYTNCYFTGYSCKLKYITALFIMAFLSQYLTIVAYKITKLVRITIQLNIPSFVFSIYSPFRFRSCRRLLL